jgi:hypothetical protein
MEEFEILVRKRGENDYAAYCPQLDVQVRGTAHEEVEGKMREIIRRHKEETASNPPPNGSAD